MSTDRNAALPTAVAMLNEYADLEENSAVHDLPRRQKRAKSYAAEIRAVAFALGRQEASGGAVPVYQIECDGSWNDVHALQYAQHDGTNKRVLAAAPVAPAPSEPAARSDAPVAAFAQLKAALQADAEYAWSWHCNFAMPIMDSIHCSAVDANKAGASLMRHVFDIDIRKHSHWNHDAARSDAQPRAPLPNAPYTHICPKCHEPAWMERACEECGTPTESVAQWLDHQRACTPEEMAPMVAALSDAQPVNERAAREEFLREIAECGVAWRKLPAVERALNTYLLDALAQSPAPQEAT